MTHRVTPETRRMVETASGVGLPQDLIGHLLDITPKTLGKRYRKEINQGKAKACMAVAQTLYNKATRDRDTASIVWFEKTRSGMREPRDPLVVQGDRNNPIQFSAVTREELTMDILREMVQSREAHRLPALEHEPLKEPEHKANGKANGS
jgi:hypothetical protein